jgi:hypothetical protein
MSSSQATTLGGSVILDNVAFTGIKTANIQDASGTVVAANGGVGLEWFQGNVYLGALGALRIVFRWTNGMLFDT